MRLRPRWLVPSVVLFQWFIIDSVTCTSWASASEIVDKAPDEHAVLLMLYDEGPAISDSLRFALKAQLSDMDAALLVVETGPLPHDLSQRIDFARRTGLRSGAVAVIWFEAVSDSEMQLYFSSTDGAQMLVRRVTDIDTAENQEMAAVIVRAGFEALVLGAEFSPMDRPEDSAGVSGAISGSSEERFDEAAQISPEHASEDNAALRVSLDAGWAMSWWRADVIAHALSLGVALRHRYGLFGRFGTLIFGPVRVSSSDVEADIRQYPLMLSMGYVYEKRRLSIAPRVGGWVAFTSAALSDLSDGEMAPSTDTRSLEIGMNTALSTSFRFLPAWRIWLSAGVELATRKVRYTALVNDQNTLLFDPWRVRPVLSAGLCFVFPL